ncbi:histidine kinase N-terminal domain-containing protein [Aneurinibacillus sp. Ricciae_BoGa-3]|uniref:histidine kinase N-terminal domain-containing protein n=1 Tax=Aneurinibacillus sp. Ricciae_BoGa-3 TaxID=3022697 RepID=UPI002341E31D|nr:histidine kinase N-terminal domain-containing protein [Aneurinibacillus sp. Ricciae_BoGa-3]WCK55663.1 histidine kinase N-terminal domain-containing protein [Aneurinibacillus sp. Ricciae_BoGa-3]
MAGTVIERFADYLEKNQVTQVSEWRRKVKISESDRFKNEVYHNGNMLYQLIIQYLRSQISLDQVKTLAEKVGIERLLADVNIGEFIYNINLGRSEIFNNLSRSEFSLQELQIVIEKINECFDCFISNALSRYINLKNADLEEMKVFVEQTHKERLTILSQISSSFVHEFRNPLTAVIGFTKLLMEKYPDLDYFDIIMHELQQLNYRITQFLLVSRKGVLEEEKEQFLLSDILSEIIAFISPGLADWDVKVVSEIEPDIYFYGYKNELRQVFINLMVNSLESLQTKSLERKIFLKAAEKETGIQIEIINNGPPIPASLLPIIFEPFVTTKELGTGIGLYICKKIIERQNGTILCSSDELRTAFTIFLPNK